MNVKMRVIQCALETRDASTKSARFPVSVTLDLEQTVSTPLSVQVHFHFISLQAFSYIYKGPFKNIITSFLAVSDHPKM